MLSKQAALIYTMVIVSASDRQMPDTELSTIGQIVQGLPVFDGFDSDTLTETAATCAEMLSAEEGLETALQVIDNALPEGLRETAYALAVEIAAADRKVELEEMRVLEMVRHRLDIDRLVAAALERAVRARYAKG
ncbi:MAG: tellurite resistance TerB family protein [Alphaproteobacteria bacterium]|nr:tellurite resistance TerB family protein [Alphaproteobacteria bacterium]